MKTLAVYSRQGCHLCEVLIEELLPLVRGRLQVEVRDVDSNEQWLRDYDIRVPLIEFEGECISEYTLDRAAVQRILAGLADSGGC